jgi:hypothetical protein
MSITTLDPKRKRKLRCVICKEPFSEYGNNTQPIASGRCCNECNTTVVIPTRLMRFMGVKLLGAKQ